MHSWPHYIPRELVFKGMPKDMRDAFNNAAQGKLRFHIHIYFDPGTPSETAAAALVEKLKTDLRSMENSGEIVSHIERAGRVPVIGPHTKPNFEVDTAPIDAFQARVWLGSILAGAAAENPGLSILLHPRTGDELKDHGVLATWFGKPTELNTGFFNQIRPDNRKFKP